MKRLLYAPWAFLVFYPVATLATMFCGTLAWAVGHLSPDAVSRIARAWARTVAFANLSRLHLEGFQPDPGQAYVIMANHQSFADVIALTALLPVQFRWVIKQELRNVPALGPACAKWGCVFVDRRNHDRAIASLQAARPDLARGVSLLIFPEGTRSEGAQLGELKKGGFMVALELGLPILPVSITGAREILPAHSLLPVPGHVRARVHHPIDTVAYGPQRRDELMRATRAVISAGLDERCARRPLAGNASDRVSPVQDRRGHSATGA